MAVVNFSPVEKTSAGVSGGTAIFGALSTSEVALWVGIVATVLTFVFAQYWQWRRDKREERRLSYELGEEEDRRSDNAPVASDRRK